MLYTIVSVYDAKAQAFGRPAFVGTVPLAVRSFDDEVNRKDENNQMNQHPEDFSLYDMGTFDDTSGVFSSHNPPKLVVDATTLKR